MPLMDGFEVLDFLAARRATLPAILLTSYASATLRRRAATVGVRYVLEKPILNGSLLERIQEVLGHDRQITPALLE